MSLIHFYYAPVSDFDRLFEDALATRFCPRYSACTPSARSSKQTAPRPSGAHRPRLDIHESEKTNTVTATLELPGLTSDHVTIDIHQNRLTVSGEFTVPGSDNEEQGTYAVRERRVGKFSRTLRLPSGTKAEDVTAKMENGVLEITFPKTTPEQEPERVVIQ